MFSSVQMLVSPNWMYDQSIIGLAKLEYLNKCNKTSFKKLYVVS